MRQGRLFGRAIEQTVAEAVKLRRNLREFPIRDIRDVEAMATLDADAREQLEAAELIADAFIGVVLAADGADVETRIAALAAEADRVVKGDERATERLVERAAKDLAKDSPSGGSRRPFHWPLEFPDVFQSTSAGFDAIVGNPPFLGGQRITGVAGTAYRDWLVAHIAEGRRGSADLVAYFFLRAWSLLRDGGGFGLLAVNTIAEGDTRQVGLEAMVAVGAVIYAAYPSEAWPGQAAVATSRVHVRKGAWNGNLTISSRSVSFISAYLAESPRDEWRPRRLSVNADISFQGSIPLGMGFVLTPDEAQRMLDADSKNVDVLFPYLNGEDLNTDPQQRPSRWVINFWDWPEERAREYSRPWAWVEEKVWPERSKNSRKERRERWWQFGEKTPALYHAIGRGHQFSQHPKTWNADMKPLARVLVCSEVTKHLAFEMIPNTYVMSANLDVFIALDRFAICQSALHDVWARKHSARLETRLKYSPGNAYETFVFPEVSEQVRRLGDDLRYARRALLTEEQIGLTKLYNRVHSPNDRDARVKALRDLQCEVDIAVAHAYGWTDLSLGHGFRSVPYLPEFDRERFTISEIARLEVLRRLGELNRQRYEEEQAAAPAAKPRALKVRAKPVPAGQGALALVDAPAPTTSKHKAAKPAKNAVKRSSR